MLGIVLNMVSDWIPSDVIPLSLASLHDDDKDGIGIRSTRLGDAVGDEDGSPVGDEVGTSDGSGVGTSVGDEEGTSVGTSVGDEVGLCVCL